MTTCATECPELEITQGNTITHWNYALPSTTAYAGLYSRPAAVRIYTFGMFNTPYLAPYVKTQPRDR